jgi:hypothetical protein
MNDAQLRDIVANETRMDKDLNYSSEQLFTEWSKQPKANDLLIKY